MTLETYLGPVLTHYAAVPLWAANRHTRYSCLGNL